MRNENRAMSEADKSNILWQTKTGGTKDFSEARMSESTCIK